MRSRDRLEELRRLADSGHIYNETVEIIVGDEKNVNNDDINELFKEVEQIRNWIHDVEGNTQLMRRLYSDPTFHANKQIQDQLESVITSSNAIGLKVCGALRQFEARASRPRNDVNARIARLQYATTRQLYSNALTEHQNTLQSIRDGQFDLLQEQIRLTNLTISDEECQNLLETKNIALFVDNGQNSDYITWDKIFSLSASHPTLYRMNEPHCVEAQTAEARLALQDVEARHSELLRIEDSIREVRDLFVQMSHLVAQQQDLVDTVEYYASQATELVEVGGQELMKGTVSRRKARNKKISLIVCLVSGFLLVLLVLIAT